MAIPVPLRDKDGFQKIAIENEARLYGALKALFDLLETYGPVWYTKQYHDKAKTALLTQERSLRKAA